MESHLLSTLTKRLGSLTHPFGDLVQAEEAADSYAKFRDADRRLLVRLRQLQVAVDRLQLKKKVLSVKQYLASMDYCTTNCGNLAQTISTFFPNH